MNDTGTNSWLGNCMVQPKWAPAVPDFAFTVLLFQMLVVFCVSQILHLLILKRLGCDTIVSQLLAGFILGKSFLGKFNVPNYEDAFLPMGSQVNNSISMLSYVLSMFIVAVKMDYTIMMKTGRKASALGLLVFVGSMFSTITTRILVSRDPTNPGLNFASSYVSVTSFPVAAVSLRELGILNSEVGRITLSAVLMAEIVCICVMLFNNTISPALGDPQKEVQAAFSIFTILSLILLIIFVMRPLMRWMIRQTPQGKPVRQVYVNLSFLFMLLAAMWTHVGHQFVMLGAYIFGAGVIDGPPLGSTVVDRLDTFITGILQPFLMASCTMPVDLSIINMTNNAPRTIAMVGFSMFVAKFVICLLCGYYFKMSARDSLAIAFLLCNKGFIDVVSYKWWFDLKNITEDVYASMEVFCLVCAIICPMAVRHLYDPVQKYMGYQIRDIMHCKPSSDLRILPCIFRPENVGAIIRFLDISCATCTEGRSVIYPLHLMKLVGRSQSVFISHDMQKKKDMSRYYSQEIVLVFRRFEMNNSKVVSIHSYTAMSPLEAMHEDICTLALDKSVSLIILPFHRTYGYEGAVDHDDHEQRAFNASVLERAPCSVGVLIDRSSQHHSASLTSIDTAEALYSVCVIFIGGNDDREALAYAKRIRLGKRVRLTILRFIALGNEDGLSANDMIYLSDIKEMCNQDSRLTAYLEETVRDGAEMALRLREVVDNYHLMIVGRLFNVDSPETAGLNHWQEIRELGIIGDLLASPDMKCKTSVLIVQQQRQQQQ
ncbi:hypothetical protein V2J09_006266 [Rumex salicifolius]